MARLINSLETKLIFSFILLIVIIAGGVFFYTFSETKKALKESTRQELMSIASAVASQIDGDTFSKITVGGESSSNFVTIHNQLQKIRSDNSNIRYIYTMRRIDNNIQFVVDADYGTTDGAKIGEVYTESAPMLIEGFQHLSADTEFTTDEWGTVLSGYAPIKNSLGENVGLVGVDMDSTNVIRQQKFIGSTIYYIMGIAILLAAIIIGIFSLTIIRDIKKLNASAEAISKGSIDVVVDIKRKDEIGELADSFSRMIASLKFMMIEEKEKNRVIEEKSKARKELKRGVKK